VFGIGRIGKGRRVGRKRGHEAGQKKKEREASPTEGKRDGEQSRVRFGIRPNSGHGEKKGHGERSGSSRREKGKPKKKIRKWRVNSHSYTCSFIQKHASCLKERGRKTQKRGEVIRKT